MVGSMICYSEMQASRLSAKSKSLFVWFLADNACTRPTCENSSKPGSNPDKIDDILPAWPIEKVPSIAADAPILPHTCRWGVMSGYLTSPGRVRRRRYGRCGEPAEHEYEKLARAQNTCSPAH